MCLVWGIVDALTLCFNIHITEYIHKLMLCMQICYLRAGFGLAWLIGVTIRVMDHVEYDHPQQGSLSAKWFHIWMQIAIASGPYLIQLTLFSAMDRPMSLLTLLYTVLCASSLTFPLTSTRILVPFLIISAPAAALVQVIAPPATPHSRFSTVFPWSSPRSHISACDIIQNSSPDLCRTTPPNPFKDGSARTIASQRHVMPP